MCNADVLVNELAHQIMAEVGNQEYSLIKSRHGEPQEDGSVSDWVTTGAEWCFDNGMTLTITFVLGSHLNLSVWHKSELTGAKYELYNKKISQDPSPFSSGIERIDYEEIRKHLLLGFKTFGHRRELHQNSYESKSWLVPNRI